MKKILLLLIWLAPIVAFAQRVEPPLALTLNASYVGGAVSVSWSGADCDGCTYWIERSKDGSAYETIGSRGGHQVLGDYEVIYSFIDMSPYSGYSYYQVRSSSYYRSVLSRTVRVFNHYSITLPADVATQ